MALRDNASAKWNEWKQELQDKENRRRVEEEIRRRLKQGKEMIKRIEKELTSPKNRAKAEAAVKEARKKLGRLKAEFHLKKVQAAAYTKANPEKALVAAAAAGALAGALWSAFHRKKHS
ncbi:MAG TPA: hypothetical protein VJ873_11955 [bacterium]|nr:hypothetical protein [bacterium]